MLSRIQLQLRFKFSDDSYPDYPPYPIGDHETTRDAFVGFFDSAALHCNSNSNDNLELIIKDKRTGSKIVFANVIPIWAQPDESFDRWRAECHCDMEASLSGYKVDLNPVRKKTSKKKGSNKCGPTAANARKCATKTGK